MEQYKPYQFSSRDSLIDYLVGVDLRKEPRPADYEGASVYFDPVIIEGSEYWLPPKAVPQRVVYIGKTIRNLILDGDEDTAYAAIQEVWQKMLLRARSDDKVLAALLYKSEQSNFYGVKVNWTKSPNGYWNVSIRIASKDFPVAGKTSYRYTYSASVLTFNREKFLEGMAEAIALRRYWVLLRKGCGLSGEDIESPPEKYKPQAIPGWSKLPDIENKLGINSFGDHHLIPFVTRNPAHKISVGFALGYDSKTLSPFKIRSVSNPKEGPQKDYYFSISILFPAMVKELLRLAGDKVGIEYSADAIEEQYHRILIRVQEALIRFLGTEVQESLGKTEYGQFPADSAIARDELSQGWLCTLPRGTNNVMQFTVPDAAKSKKYSLGLARSVVSKLLAEQSVSLEDIWLQSSGANKLKFFPHTVVEVDGCQHLVYSDERSYHIPYRSLPALSFPVRKDSSVKLAETLRKFFLVKHDPSVPKRFSSLKELLEHPFRAPVSTTVQDDWIALAMMLLESNVENIQPVPKLATGLRSFSLKLNKEDQTAGLAAGKKPRILLWLPTDSKESFNRAYMHALAVERCKKDQKITDQNAVEDHLRHPDFVSECYDFGILPNPGLYKEVRDYLGLPE